jgi:hypothetical protein
VSAKSFEHANMKVIKTHPYALKIICANRAQVLYFEDKDKLNKWSTILEQIVEERQLKTLMNNSASRKSFDYSNQFQESTSAKLNGV